MRNFEVASTLVAVRGFIMETERTEGIVEKAVAYVKDMFGTPPYHRHVDSEGRPIMPTTAAETEVTSDDAMRLDPYTFKSVGELHIESARRDDGAKEPLSPAELHGDGPTT
jgi:hypothetical protein